MLISQFVTIWILVFKKIAEQNMKSSYLIMLETIFFELSQISNLESEICIDINDFKIETLCLRTKCSE